MTYQIGQQVRINAKGAARQQVPVDTMGIIKPCMFFDHPSAFVAYPNGRREYVVALPSELGHWHWFNEDELEAVGDMPTHSSCDHDWEQIWDDGVGQRCCVCLHCDEYRIFQYEVDES